MFSGQLEKMKATLGDKVQYYFDEKHEEKNVNKLIGKLITIEYLNKITCIGCKKQIKKSYQQGYCFVCTQKLAVCDFCILSPDRCHFDKGTCREPKWGQENCMIPHYVYISNTSGIKVGLTRHTQVPTRWIDQGAIQAAKVIEASTRHKAGIIEKLLGKDFADKTNWRKMLQKDIEYQDIKAVTVSAIDKYKDEILLIDKEVKFLINEEAIMINYPYIEQPKKIVSLKLDKTPVIKSTLLGIKGQYLILEDGVFNVRNHTGHHASIY